MNASERKLKPPLQALLIADDFQMRKNILHKIKQITIRERHRDYRPGLVMLCDHINPWVVQAEITTVRHCLLREVTEKEYKADGFETTEELLRGMQHFYPRMTFESPVTVIHWCRAQGHLMVR